MCCGIVEEVHGSFCCCLGVFGLCGRESTKGYEHAGAVDGSAIIEQDFNDFLEASNCGWRKCGAEVSGAAVNC